MTKTKRVITLILCLALCFTVGGELLAALTVTAKAETVEYSNVLDDLSQDKNFYKALYPEVSYEEYISLKNDDDPDNNVNLITVIQIAESKSGEFFIYTYQPLNNSHDITANKIGMYLGEDTAYPDLNDSSTPKYSLKCVSQEGVFNKYLVLGITIPDETYHYYNLVEIEHPFNEALDDKISDETIIISKAEPIGQRWCSYYVNNELKYEMTTLDVVIIKPTLTDFLFCEDGVTWGSLVGIESGCNAHFIAFNIDNYNVDKIFDASMEYYKCDFITTHVQDSGVIPLIRSLFGISNEHTTTSYPNGMYYERVLVELDIQDDPVVYTGEGLLSNTYSWNRIMTAEAFISKCDDEELQMSENVRTSLLQSQYVFAFAETPVSYKSFNTNNPSDNNIDWSSSTTTVINGTDVTNVDILRLHFESAGKTYNLGVVGDVTRGDALPGIVSDDKVNFDDIFERILALLAIIILLVLLGWIPGVLTFVITVISNVLSVTVSVVVWILKLPFSILKLFRDD